MHTHIYIYIYVCVCVCACVCVCVCACVTEYMCYNQTGDISTLDETSLKLVDKFTYLEAVSHQPKKTSTQG